MDTQIASQLTADPPAVAPQTVAPPRTQPQAGGPQATLIADGSRLHLNHGPIDLIISADGSPAARRRAFDAAASRFDGLLEELVHELDVLRTPAQSQPTSQSQSHPQTPAAGGAVAQRMLAAVWPYRDRERITPMAAVAGAVADEIGAAITNSDPAGDLTRWMVNNGGDIAIWLAAGQAYRVGVVMGHPSLLAPLEPLVACSTGAGTDRIDTHAGALAITSEMRIGGIATSGQPGRSFSLGIADSVTVLANNAAAADAAATLIANRVDLPDHPGIRRTPACELDPDNDLGQIPITVDVPSLEEAEAATALGAGLSFANELVSDKLIVAAILHLCGLTVSTSRQSSQ